MIGFAIFHIHINPLNGFIGIGEAMSINIPHIRAPYMKATWEIMEAPELKATGR
jgi:hypothetical protein